MARGGEIDSIIVVRNNNEGFVYLKQEVLEDKYPDLLPNRFNLNQPQFSFTVGSLEWFQQRISALQDEGVDIDPYYDTRTNWIGPLMGWLLPFFIIVAAISKILESSVHIDTMIRVSDGGRRTIWNCCCRRRPARA